MYQRNGKEAARQSIPRTIVMLAAIMAMTLGVLGSPTAEAAYPSKPITIIVPWAPGSIVDLVPRIMSPYFSKKLGVPVNIVNKPGGSAVPGVQEAVTAPADGHTILADCPGSSSIQKAWLKDLPYKVEERSYFARAVVNPQAFTVRGTAPWKTLKDVEEAIRKDPASFRWGAVGTTQSDFGLFLLKAAFTKKGLDLSKTKTVSFQSATPAMNALAGGHIDIYFGGLNQQSYVDAGKARYVAVSATERTHFYPGIPTTVEQGFPSVLSQFWVGFSGNQRIPPDVVQTWETLVKEVVNDPAYSKEWDKLGQIPAFLPKEEFRKMVLDEALAIKAVTPQ